MSIKSFFAAMFGKTKVHQPELPVVEAPKPKPLTPAQRAKLAERARLKKLRLKEQRAKQIKKEKERKLKLKKLKAENLKKEKARLKKLKAKGKKMVYDKERYTRRKVGSDGRTYVYDSSTNDWLLLAAVAYIVFSSNHDHEFDGSGNLLTDPDDRGYDSSSDDSSSSSSDDNSSSSDYDSSSDSSDYSSDSGSFGGDSGGGGGFD